MNRGCYCCAKPSGSKRMDVDAALHELGMLSTSTESRQQFLREQKRSKSESSSCPSSSVMKDCNNLLSDSISPKAYKIIQINPAFVTGFKSDIILPEVQGQTDCASDNTVNASGHNRGRSRSNVYIPCKFGADYRRQPDVLEMDVRSHRLARIKLGRHRRFRKPYEVPWRLHHSLPLPETQNLLTCAEDSWTSLTCDERTPDCDGEGGKGRNHSNAQTSTSPSSGSKSNSSSPVKLPNLVIHRSKSLDDLDLAKLKISELSRDQNFVLQREEIELMSENLKDLHMKE